MTVIAILLYVVAAILVVVGLAGAVLPAIPGPPIIFGGLWLASGVDGYAHVGLWALIFIGILGVVAIILDYVAGVLGAKHGGASKWAIAGATLGTIVGMFFALPGLILGPFIGALLGEFIAGSNVQKSTQVSVYTWIGMLFGMIAKIVLSVMMIGIWVFFWFV